MNTTTLFRSTLYVFHNIFYLMVICPLYSNKNYFIYNTPNKELMYRQYIRLVIILILNICYDDLVIAHVD